MTEHNYASRSQGRGRRAAHGNGHGHGHAHGNGRDHAHGNGRDHAHDHDAPMWALGTALAITAVVFVAELVGGWLSGSMALMADAMHMLSDSTSLAIAFIAVFIGSRVRSARATYGYRRVEVLAAALNAATVLLVSVWIVYQAFGRFGAGAEVDTRTMIIVAVVGLIANVASAWVLNAQREKSLNVEGAFLHVIVDLFGSVAVIIAGGVIALTGWQVADVIASLLIAALVVPRAWQLLKSSTSVLLEQVPEGIDPRQVQEELEGLSGVEAVHDLHLWSTNGSDALCTAHLITRLAEPFRLLDLAQERLTALGIAHATIQIERPEHSAHETFCEPGQ